MKKQMYKLFLFVAALTLLSCECPYLEEKNSPYYRNKGNHLTADLLPGLWQCYYPMIVGTVEFKEVRMFSNGKADIIMENLGGSSSGAMMVITSHSLRATSPISSKSQVGFPQNSICAILAASTPGPIAEPKIVSNKYSSI